MAVLLACLPVAGAVAQQGDDLIAQRVAAFAEAYDAGRYEDAAALGEIALRMSREAFGDRSEQTGFLMLNLAKVYLRLSRPDDAYALFDEARSSFSDEFGADHPAVFDAELGLAAAAEFSDPMEAAARYAAVVARMRALPQSDPVMLANAEVGLARAHRLTGNDAAAVETYALAVRRFAENLGPYHPATAQTRAAWATVQTSPWLAADTLIESWRALRRALGDAHPETERVGMAAARTLLDLGLPFDAMEVALPLAVWARPAAHNEAVAVLEDAWVALQDPAAAIRTVRTASPPEEAEPGAKEAAAAHLAITLVRFNRSIEAVIAIDRARRLIGSLGTADPELAEALARIADPVHATAATLNSNDLLAEATAIVDRLDAAHPRHAELDGLIALARAHQTVAEGRPGEAAEIARDAVDRITGADDPRGILRLRLRLALAGAFAAAGNDRLAAVAYNGLERDIVAAAGALTDLAGAQEPLLLTPTEAVEILQVCEGYWRDKAADDRLQAVQAAISKWRQASLTWPAPPPAEAASTGD